MAQALQLREGWHARARVSLLAIPLFWVARYYAYLSTPAAISCSFGVALLSGILKKKRDSCPRTYFHQVAIERYPSEKDARV